MEKKLSGDTGDRTGPFACKANAVPLSYIAILEDRAFKTHLFTFAHYFVGIRVNTCNFFLSNLSFMKGFLTGTIQDLMA